jgi:hypothetical protein
MALTTEQKKKLINLGLSTGGGAGAGAIAEYLARGKVGWMGPTGGALAGGGGYLAASPKARGALKSLVGWGDAEDAEAPKKKEDKDRKPTVKEEEALALFVLEYGQKHNRLPTAQELKDAVPSTPSKAIKDIALQLMTAQENTRDTNFSAPGIATDIQGKVVYPVTGLAYLTSLVSAVFPKVVPKVVSGTATKAGPIAWGLNTAYDGVKGNFYDETKQEWSGNVLKNLKSTQRESIRNLTDNNAGIPLQTGQGILQGLFNPIRSYAATALTGNDIDAERDKWGFDAIKDTRRRGGSSNKALLNGLLARFGRQTKPFTDAETAHAKEFDFKRNARIASRRQAAIQRRKEHASGLVKSLNPTGRPWSEMPGLKNHILSEDKRLREESSSDLFTNLGDWLL